MITPASATAAPSTFPVWSIVRKLEFFGFLLLLTAGIVFYLWWGFSFGVWLDNGVYAVTITLVLFGLAGMWLVTPNPAPTPKPNP